MTTLLQRYITSFPPSDWQRLFKEASNVAFQIKYMFRESRQIATQRFLASAENMSNLGKQKNPSAVQALLRQLVGDSVAAYGESGLYDPAELAKIDFLSQVPC